MRTLLSVEVFNKSCMETGRKISKPNGKNWGKNPRDQWEHTSPVKNLMSLKESYCWWKTSQPSYGRLRRKTGQKNQSMKKPSNLNWELGRKNRGFCWKKGLWSRRDLVRIRCYLVFREGKLQIVPSTKMQASQHSLHQRDRSPASY